MLAVYMYDNTMCHSTFGLLTLLEIISQYSLYKSLLTFVTCTADFSVLSLLKIKYLRKEHTFRFFSRPAQNETLVRIN